MTMAPMKTDFDRTAYATLDEAVEAYFRQVPNAMTLIAAREIGCPEVEVVRRLPALDSSAPSVVELDPNHFEELIRSLVGQGKFYVFVSNGLCTMESVDEFGGISTVGPWLNIEKGELDMHLNTANLGACLAVTKLSHMTMHPVLSLQFFDSTGASGVKIFFNLKGPDLTEERAGFYRELCERFALESAAVTA